MALRSSLAIYELAWTIDSTKFRKVIALAMIRNCSMRPEPNSSTYSQNRRTKGPVDAHLSKFNYAKFRISQD